MGRLLPTVAALLAACAADPGVSVAAPLADPGDPYERAAATPLPERAPEDWPGLPHVYRLSENVVSGGEPVGEAAFRRLAGMGVRTVLSVDGKPTDAETARAAGLRVVHVPVEYRGLDGDEIAGIAKTFRELEGPFYVHCFHGRHRGPAAAAIGRLVLDGASRDRVLAEMRQWCGTSPRYAGLYATIATAEIPDAAATAAHPFAFPEVAPVDHLRDAMVGIGRAEENLVLLAENGFAPDPEHPDLDAGSEAAVLERLFASSVALESVAAGPADLRRWMDESLALSRALTRHLGADDLAAAGAALDELSARCAACHRAHRNR